MGTLSTANVAVYLNDKRVHSCTNLTITADVNDNLIYCSFLLIDGSDFIKGRGYLERVLEGSFHIRLIDGDDDLSINYLRKLYL